MSAGATKDYSFGQKNHWRRTLWNEILRRTDGREKNEVVLYLAGPKDLDRGVAIQKGVPAQNLIAIDRCLKNVEAVRSGGNPALHADVFEVLSNWPAGRPVCAVVLDLCGGLPGYDTYNRLVDLLTIYPPMLNAVVALNFLRGRDDNECARWMRQRGNDVVVRTEAFRRGLVSPKHRGMAFASGYAETLVRKVLEMYARFYGPPASDAVVEEVVDGALRKALAAVRLKPFSYASGALRFDSVVMSPSWPTFADFYADKRPPVDQLLHAFRSNYESDHAVKRKISATLAVRTTRMNAGGR